MDPDGMREFKGVLEDLTRNIEGNLQEKETQFLNMKMCVKLLDRLEQEASEENS